jgi:hypothetical protein
MHAKNPRHERGFFSSRDAAAQRVCRPHRLRLEKTPAICSKRSVFQPLPNPPNPPPRNGLSRVAGLAPQPRFARSSVIVLTYASFQRQFTFNRVLFIWLCMRFACRCHPESSCFCTRRLVGRFPAQAENSRPAFFVSSLQWRMGELPANPASFMHLPPFHGHAGANSQHNLDECFFAN